MPEAPPLGRLVAIAAKGRAPPIRAPRATAANAAVAWRRRARLWRYQYDRHRRVLISMTCGAHAVIPIGDDQRASRHQVASYQDDRRHRLTFAYLLQIVCNMPLVLG